MREQIQKGIEVTAEFAGHLTAGFICLKKRDLLRVDMIGTIMIVDKSDKGGRKIELYNNISLGVQSEYCCHSLEYACGWYQ